MYFYKKLYKLRREKRGVRCVRVLCLSDNTETECRAVQYVCCVCCFLKTAVSVWSVDCVRTVGLDTVVLEDCGLNCERPQ